jgi:hypothetical protein
MEIAADAKEAPGILRILQPHHVGEERMTGRSGKCGRRDVLGDTVAPDRDHDRDGQEEPSADAYHHQ